MELGINEKQLRSLKAFSVPVGTIVASIIITFVFGNYFWGNIQTVRREIQTNSREENLLEEKLDILQSNQLQIQESQSVVTTALPIYSSATLVLNHLFRLQNEYQVRVSELEIRDTGSSTRSTADVNSVSFNYILTGNYESTTAFLDELKEVSPIIEFEELIFSNRTSNEVEVEVSMFAFYSAPPATLPEISEPIENLNDNEKAVISVIDDYIQPSIREAQIINKPTGKQNPFILEESAN